MWESKIGTGAINVRDEAKVGYYLDENNQWMGPTKTKDARVQSGVRTQQRTQNPKTLRYTRKRLPISDIVKVPTSVLLSVWRIDESSEENVSNSEGATLAMKKLDDAMKNLRKSRTVNALERSSLDVSVALIDVATYHECHNPFLCLQQAVIFAALGSKRGNNDEPFRKFLPLERRCSSLEALIILGRADCMRAIHFLDEAQFLCSWVARVCRRHREGEDDLIWDSRWRVIGVLSYIVAATIDETAAALSEDDEKLGKFNEWEDIVKEEINYGKAEALHFMKLSQKEESGSNIPLAKEDDVPNENREAVTIDDSRAGAKETEEDDGDPEWREEQNVYIDGEDQHEYDHQHRTEFSDAHRFFEYDEELHEPGDDDVNEEGDADEDLFSDIDVVGV